MRRDSKNTLLAVAALALLGLASSAPAQEPCAACHASVTRGKLVHAPTEDCSGCHEAVSQPHPQKGKKTFKLAAEGAALCTTCHDAFTGKKQTHAPVEAGECTACHSPHASDFPKLLTGSQKDVCGACHDDQLSAAHLHGPVSAGDCTSCHEPHHSDIQPLLKKPTDELCATCHTEAAGFQKAAHVHQALEAGCTGCHNPHGAAQPKLLVAKGAALCAPCHDDVMQKLAKATVVHAPVKSEKGCATCHNPHASAQAKLLPAAEKDTCLGCHPTILTKAMTNLHGPIKDGSCTACHDPHASSGRKLLVGEFPTEAYVPYTDKEYELCFSCHDRALLGHADTSFATGFRDGERNLHFLHVNNAQKGRSCRLCHAIHGGPNPGLIADKVPFGKWSLPLNYVRTTTGGGCTPGCHRAASYDRQSPGRKPPVARPATAKTE